MGKILYNTNYKTNPLQRLAYLQWPRLENDFNIPSGYLT